MRAALIAAVLGAGMLAGGCIPRRDVTDELDRGWYLDENPWPRAQPKPLVIGTQRLPTRWMFRRDDSTVRSAASIARAVDALRAGTDQIDMAVSPAHARTIESILAEVRAALERLKDIADPDDPPSPGVWAAAVADALIQGEIVARAATAPSPPAPAPREPATRAAPAGTAQHGGLSAGAMLEMVIAYLNERAGGRLLAGIDATEIGRLREIIAQVILRLGFAVAGKEPPEALRGQVSSELAQAPDPRRLRAPLRKRLRAELEAAPPALGDEQLRSLLRAVVGGVPSSLEVVESFVRQWPRINALELELRYADGEPLLAVTIDVAPGRSVRLAKLHPLAPAIVFRGRSRIIVVLQAPGTGEAAVLFEAGAAGATELRFEGILYGLVRLMAMPLADGTLREIRVLSTKPCRGRKTFTLAMLMEAEGRGDPRRLFVLHDVRDVRVLRTAFEVRRIERRRDLTASYVTPAHLYTYRRPAAAADLSGVERRE